MLSLWITHILVMFMNSTQFLVTAYNPTSHPISEICRVVGTEAGRQATLNVYGFTVQGHHVLRFLGGIDAPARHLHLVCRVTSARF